MTIALYLDSDFLADCATTSGWGDFCKWAATINNAPQLAALCADGSTDHAAALLGELSYLAEKYPPTDPDVADVLAGIVASLEAATIAEDDSQAVIVSDGLGDIPDEAVEDDPATIAADKRAKEALADPDFELADDPDPDLGED